MDYIKNMKEQRGNNNNDDDKKVRKTTFWYANPDFGFLLMS